jgi:hypothetical protein
VPRSFSRIEQAVAAINALAELDAIEWKFERVSTDEVKCLCPFHEDHNPSCFVNIRKLEFHCHSCHKSGNIRTFLAGASSIVLRKEVTYAVIDAYLNSKYGLGGEGKHIEIDVIERLHTAIWQSAYSLDALSQRGVYEDDIRKYRIGFDINTNRITIPIRSESGLFVNLRMYAPGATDRAKMMSKRHHGEARLFPIEQLKYDTIVLCGGELKAIAAAKQLNQHNIGAISTTAGENELNPAFTKDFKDKKVFVCYDIDKAGKDAAEKTCRRLSKVTTWVGKIILPLSVERYPKGDISDFIGKENGNLFSLLDSCPQWISTQITQATEAEEEIHDLTFNKISESENINKIVRFTATVSGKGDVQWAISKEVKVICPKNKAYCEGCPVADQDDDYVFKIPITSSTVLECINAPKRFVTAAVRDAIGIPEQCNVCELQKQSWYSLNLVFIQPRVSVHEMSQHESKPVYCETRSVMPGSDVNIVARVMEHPRTTEITLVAKTLDVAVDNLATFKCENMEELMLFRPSEWTTYAMEQVFHRRYHDIELNITKIYCRRDMHIVCDVVYHSVLQFNFRGQQRNGWARALIIGDTSQGKSQLVSALQKHYGLGHKDDCVNASYAGLVGGVTSYDSNKYISWGSLVQNDRGLIVFEEATQLREIMAHLTNTFSEGVARITKVVRGSANARTRILMLSNPPDTKAMASYVHGIRVVKDVIGTQQDIRRLDLLQIVNRTEVTNESKFAHEKQRTAHIFTSELCRKLILWSWSRDLSQVQVSEEMCILIRETAMRLIAKFESNIPVIDEGSTYEKVARIALALAAMTFSSDESYNVIVLRRCHVEYAEILLNRLYLSKACGYDEYASKDAKDMKLRNVRRLDKRLTDMARPKIFAEKLLQIDLITVEHFMHITGCDRSSADILMSVLLDSNSLIQVSQANSLRLAYVKTPEFITYLKEFIANFKPDPGRPSHSEGEEEKGDFPF